MNKYYDRMMGELHKQATELGRKCGYGQLMAWAQEDWGRSLAFEWGDPIAGGVFAIGPCIGMTVPCECKPEDDCEWCCGSGWITKRVKQAKDQDAK